MPRRPATAPPDPQRPESPPFDALALKRQAQEELREATAGMTREEERSFYRQRARSGPLGAWWAKIEARGKSRPSNGERGETSPPADDPATEMGQEPNRRDAEGGREPR